MSAIAFLDGGLGQEINKRSNQSNSHPLWSTQVMMEFPEIVIAVQVRVPAPFSLNLIII